VYIKPTTTKSQLKSCGTIDESRLVFNIRNLLLNEQSLFFGFRRKIEKVKLMLEEQVFVYPLWIPLIKLWRFRLFQAFVGCLSQRYVAPFILVNFN